jgi:branched-chain amino acid transport system ATP-binding protein
VTSLSVEGLDAGYGRADVLHDINIEVKAGEVVVVLGANGAGKTTLMRALAGTIARRGAIRFEGRSIESLRADQIARLGIRLVPQGRGTMPHLSVRDNLLVGAYTTRRRSGAASAIDAWAATFPNLGRQLDKKAGSLSGGEQQMLAIARALIAEPKLLLCDEPSLGLAPIIVTEVFEFLKERNRAQGTALLLVEQNADRALAIAARGYLLESGEIVGEGGAAELRDSPSVRQAYLGV